MTEIVDEGDLRDLEAALDAMETLHDAVAIGDETVRKCLCGEAASWRRGITVTAAIRQRMGLRPRLIDQALLAQMGHRT